MPGLSGMSGLSGLSGLYFGLYGFKVIAEGDSLTQGYLTANPPVDSWPGQAAAARPAWTVVNLGDPGETSAQTLTEAAAEVDAIYDSNKASNIAVLWIGVNDTRPDPSVTSQNACYANIRTWCLARRAAGYLIVVGTITPNQYSGVAATDNTAETARLNVNQFLRDNCAEFADALCDIGADATIGVFANCTNLTYYQSDKLHLTRASDTIVTNLLLPILDSLVRRSAGPTGVTATQSGNNVLVSWNPVAGATSYHVKRGSATTVALAPGAPATVLSTAPTGTTYTDTAPVSPAINRYSVTAVVNGVETAPGIAPLIGISLTPILYVRADMGVTNATAGAAINNDTLGAMADQSGNGRNAVTSAAPAPTYLTAQVNTKPGIRFGGTSSLKIPAVPLGPHTIHVLAKLDVGATAGMIWEHGPGVLSVGNGSGLSNASPVAQMERGSAYWEVKELTPGWAEDGLPHVFSFVSDGTYSSLQVYVDGVLQPTSTTVNSGDTGSVSYTGDLNIFSRNQASLFTTGLLGGVRVEGIAQTAAQVMTDVKVMNAIWTQAGVPTSFSVTGGALQTNLSWDALAGANSYNLYRSTAAGAEVLVHSGITATAYNDTGLAAGTTYYYKLSAVTGGTEGPLSQELSAVTTPAMPTGLTAAQVPSSRQLAISWAATPGATSYNLFRSTASGAEVQVATGLTGTNYTDTGLTASTLYYYTLQAVNAAGTSAQSAETSATTHAPSSTLLDSLKAYWTLNEATGNRVDSSINGADMVPNNAPGNVAGVVGNALNLVQASQQYVKSSAPGLLLTSTQNWSIAFWFKPSAAGYFISEWTGGKMQMYYDGTGTISCGSANIAGVVLNQWNLIVFTFASTGVNTGTSTFYRGTGSTLTAGTPVTGNVSAPGTLPLTLGYANGGGYNTAAMDEAGYWGKTLSSSDATNLLNGGAGVTCPFTGVP